MNVAHNFLENDLKFFRSLNAMLAVTTRINHVRSSNPNGPFGGFDHFLALITVFSSHRRSIIHPKKENRSRETKNIRNHHNIVKPLDIFEI